MAKFKRLDETERNLIGIWSQEDVSVREIARRLHRSPSTVSREIKRNAAVGGGYAPARAQRRAKRLSKRPGPRKLTEEMVRHAHAKLRESALQNPKNAVKSRMKCGGNGVTYCKISP